LGYPRTEDLRSHGWPGEEREAPVMVSIVIPAYNAEDTLEATVRSALVQRGADFEVVVVDDGSDDRTRDVAQRVASSDPRVTVLTQANAGTAAALNAGYAEARGEFIAALGADDELLPGYLETMAGFIGDHPGFDIYSHDLWRVRPDGLKHRTYGWNTVRSVGLTDLIRECLISGGGTLVRRELFESLGGFREDAHSEDYDFWLRALSGGAKHIYVPAVLYIYRQAPGGQKTANAIATLQSDIRILEDLLASGKLDETQARQASRSIANHRQEARDIESLGGETMTEVMGSLAAARLATIRSGLSRLLPEAAAARVVEAIYGMRWVVRPFRRAIWRFRVWRYGNK